MNKQNEHFQIAGIFITKQRYVKAVQLATYQQFIDSNGEEFTGIPGDWKIWDEDGYVYYMNKHEFQYRYRPFTQQAFELYRTRKKINSLNLTIQKS